MSDGEHIKDIGESQIDVFRIESYIIGRISLYLRGIRLHILSC